MSTTFGNSNSRMTENVGGINSGMESTMNTGAYPNRETPRGHTENMAGGLDGRENVHTRDGLNTRDHMNTHGGLNTHTRDNVNARDNAYTHGGLNTHENLHTQESMMAGTGTNGRTEGLTGHHHQSQTAGGLNSGMNNSTINTNTRNMNSTLDSSPNSNPHSTTHSTTHSNTHSSGRHPRSSISNLPSGLSGAGPGVGASSKPTQHMNIHKGSISGVRDPRDAPTNSVDVGPPDAAHQPPSVMREQLGQPKIEHDYPEDSTARRHSATTHQERHFGGMI